MARRKPRQRKHKRRKTLTSRWRRLFWRSVKILLVVTAVYTVYLDFSIRAQFEGKRWALPARVYARPLELFSGSNLRPAELVQELKAIGYRSTPTPRQAGSYWRIGDDVHLVTRKFDFWDGAEKSRRLSLRFRDGQLSAMREQGSGANIDIARLEPLLIGGIYPSHNEDRLLVRLEDVPPLLVNALIAIEDREFYAHHGIVPKGIARALWQNLRAGKTVQGGSTITQQLVKNFFLTQQRSLWRKANEAIMALLLEWHYEKDEILEAYLNEVYLGQTGKRAIHGFGLASRFYFGQHLDELDAAQTAFLIAVVKGPSFYNPRRNLKRAIKRRDLVLFLMHERGLLSKNQYNKAKRSRLKVIPRPRASATDYPAYLDLVKRQLRRDYRDEDLRSEGLQIFTAFDPQVQWRSERALTRRIESLEKQRGLPKNKLQGAVIVTSIDNGEVLAVVGGRSARSSGFNRALDAVRPVGSLIKPAVYLAALERSADYSLATLLDDTFLKIDLGGGEYWQPLNYDKRYHGQVTLFDALVHSYNVPTVRLGQELGTNTIAATLKRLGVSREVHRFPSLSLGTSPLSPIEVTQMYQTLAAGGFRSPLRAIREVLDVDGKPLQRYPLIIEQAFEAGPIYLVNSALRAVVSEGTASKLLPSLPEDLEVAGKTGTTDDLRDSWFAGFTGSQLAVVWLGMDDNKAAGLTGAAGAMRVWSDIIGGIDTRSLALVAPANIEEIWIDRASGLRGSDECENAVVLPFIKGTAPVRYAECVGGGVYDAVKSIFNFLDPDE